MPKNLNVEDGKIKYPFKVEENEDHILLYDAETDEDKSRTISAQELINTLEDGIAKIEKYKGEKLIKQLSKTLVFVCKILAVELDKLIPEELNDKSYIA